MNSPALELELTRLALIALLFLMASNLLLRHIPTLRSPFSISITTTYPFTHIHDFPSYLLYTLHILLPFLSFSWSTLRYTWRWALDDPFPLFWHKTHTHHPSQVASKMLLDADTEHQHGVMIGRLMGLPFGAPWNGRARLEGWYFNEILDEDFI